MTDMTVAKTIMAQLGGNRFMAMTGAHNLVGTKDGLGFKIMKNAKEVTHVNIVLTWKDLYDITFLKVISSKKMPKVETVSEECDIYAEDLQMIFTAGTGLDTHL